MASLLAFPQRCVIGFTGLEYHYFAPFSSTPARNLLKGFDGSEPVEDDGTGLNVIDFLLMHLVK